VLTGAVVLLAQLSRWSSTSSLSREVQKYTMRGQQNRATQVRKTKLALLQSYSKILHINTELTAVALKLEN
jgi:hypothetical protein